MKSRGAIDRVSYLKPIVIHCLEKDGTQYYDVHCFHPSLAVASVGANFDLHNIPYITFVKYLAIESGLEQFTVTKRKLCLYVFKNIDFFSDVRDLPTIILLHDDQCRNGKVLAASP